MDRQQLVLLLIPFGFLALLLLEEHADNPNNPNNPRPDTGRTYNNQNNESYCLECIEGHTMKGSTEMRHAIDRYRTAGKMTPGVTEKVIVAISEVQGIDEDVQNLEDVSPEVKKSLNEILDEARWIRKEYGLAGKGLTTGHGTERDLTELKARIKNIQDKAYDLVSKCPTCRVTS